MGHSSSEQPQEGESEGNMTADKAVVLSQSYHLPRTCVLDAMLCTSWDRAQNGKWSE